MQLVTYDIEDVFGPVKKSIRNRFMLELFQGVVEGIPERGLPACQ